MEEVKGTVAWDFWILQKRMHDLHTTWSSFDFGAKFTEMFANLTDIIRRKTYKMILISSHILTNFSLTNKPWLNFCDDFTLVRFISL